MNEDITTSAVLDYIKNQGGATYADIEEIFSDNGFDYKGDLLLCSEHDPNVVFWGGWNNKAHELICSLIRSGEIVREPCHIIQYLVSGRFSNLPLLQRYSEKSKLKNEHWLPCIFTKPK